MEPNLNNTFEYDKHVINIDSVQGVDNNGNDFGYYIKFDEVFKNVVALQIMNVSVVIPSISSAVITNPTTTNIVTLENGDAGNTKTRTTTTETIVINNNADGSVVETNTTTVKTEILDASDAVISESTITNTTNTITGSPLFVVNQDKFYITLNEIDRGISYINDGNNNFNIVKYLEVVEYTGIKSESNIGTSTCSFLESSTHMFNPVIQRLDRFDVSVKNTNFESIPKSNIASVNIKLCLYTIKKNII